MADVSFRPWECLHGCRLSMAQCSSCVDSAEIINGRCIYDDWKLSVQDFANVFPPSKVDASASKISWIQVRRKGSDIVNTGDQNEMANLVTYEDILKPVESSGNRKISKSIRDSVVDRLLKKAIELRDTSGKWIIRAGEAIVDRVWKEVAIMTYDGLLGHSSKVSTKDLSQNSFVICVYVNFDDAESKKDVRNQLVKLTLLTGGQLCKYKPDIYTRLGIYSNQNAEPSSRIWIIDPSLELTEEEKEEGLQIVRSFNKLNSNSNDNSNSYVNSNSKEIKNIDENDEVVFVGNKRRSHIVDSDGPVIVPGATSEYDTDSALIKRPSKSDAYFPNKLLSDEYFDRTGIYLNKWTKIVKSETDASRKLIREQDEAVYYFDSRSDLRAKHALFFDLDGTLILTKSGRPFPKDENDWKYFSDNVPTKLSQYKKEGCYIAIISNQNGIGVGITGAYSQLIDKLNQIRISLSESYAIHSRSKESFPIDVIFAFQKVSYFRKPMVGAFEFLIRARGLCRQIEQSDQNETVEMTYVGDAAGRLGDHSDCDLKFAANSNLNFKTPEEFFQIPWRCKMCDIDNSFDSLKCNICEALRPENFKNGNVLKEKLIRSAELRLSDVGEKLPSHANNRDCVFDNCYDRLIKKHMPLDTIRIAKDKEIVLLVGPICCGKSTLARDFLSRGYCVISDGDVTKQALPTLCSSITDELLRLAESKVGANYQGFIIDSASLRLHQNRSKWVALANKLGLGVRCILFDVPKRHCIMLNNYRQLRSITHNNVFVINKVAKNETKDSTFIAALGHSFNEVNDNIPNNSQGFVCVTTIGWTPLHQHANIDDANKSNHMRDNSSISVLDSRHICSSQPDTISPVLFSYYY